MDFFLEQDKARSRTGRLLILFILAVVLLILTIYAAVMAVLLYYSSEPTGFFNPKLFFVIAGATIAVIGIGTLLRIKALSSGGSYVAESLGGKIVNLSTADPDQQKLINVVEEMAIASGTPVPPVYLLEKEEGINAFAAGFSPNDAVIGVTLGCCKRLNREELQGVIAHEFSHILNGDMRLNIRLMGLLGGIMAISNIGYTVLRGSRYRSSGSSRRSGKGGGQIIIIALLLLVLGYVGVLIGRLIQSALSRQREYLADASAVQFTRSTAIADALKKIGGFTSGSKIIAPAAVEAGHIFFGKATSSLFDTHPPLIDRIRKIDPGFSGDFSAPEAIAAPAETSGFQPFSSYTPAQELSISPDTVRQSIGTITPEAVANGAAILSAIPEALKNEIQDPLGAYALVCALLLDPDPEVKNKQLELLGESAPPEILRQIQIVQRSIETIPPEMKLPLVDMALPSLRQISPDQFIAFKNHLELLMEADSRISVFEFSLHTVILHRLETAFTHPASGILYKSISPLTEDAIALCAVLALAGHKDKPSIEKAFRAGISSLPIQRQKTEMPDHITFTKLQSSLERLSRASSGVKKTVFDACCQSVLLDNKVTISEAELLRAFAYAMDIPVPPLSPLK